MIRREELTDYLATYLDTETFEDYCPNGLQVEGKSEISRLVTAVSASQRTIELAIEQGADALVVHHGFFWKGEDPTLTGPMRRKLDLLFRHNLNLYGYHLPLDAHQQVGNNWVAARALGLTKLKPFGRLGKIDAGVAGHLPPTPIEEWVSHLEAFYGQSARSALGGPPMVEQVGLVSGGAHRMLPEAKAAGLDCFITGSGDEPNWHQAHEQQIHFLAMGHSATEVIGPKALADHLAKRFKLETSFLDVFNPF